MTAPEVRGMGRRSFLACGAAALGVGAASVLGGAGAGRALASSGEGEADADANADAGGSEGEQGVLEAGGYTLLPYDQYASGGVATPLYAVILFENKNSTFTRYQVAYTSCTCRDAASNYRSVMYVELLNNKDTAAEAKVRKLTYGQVDGYDAGVWGDSDPVHDRPDYTQEYMDENFVQKLVGLTIGDIDAWEGYGTQPEAVDADAVAGATVSTSNIMSVLQSLASYHAAKYYGE